MHPLLRTAILVALVAAPGFTPAVEGSFDPRIVTFGPAREQLKSTPITQRPNRPLHVYGNTVRRRHRRTVPAQRPASRAAAQPGQPR